MRPWPATRPAPCRRPLSCAPTPRWPWAAASMASPMMRRTRPACWARWPGARTACSPPWPCRQAPGARRRCPCRACLLPRGRRRRSPPMWPPANRWARPGPTAYRGGRQRLCNTWRAAIQASWACPCTTPHIGWARWVCRHTHCLPATTPLQPHHAPPAAMQQDILINWSPQETRVAVVEHGAVQELHIERTLERGLVGNIYLGKVARVLPGMQSAFIDIGLERAAFLHVADLGQPKPDGEAPLFARKGQPQVPIEKQVFDGQALMVQVIKEPIGTKGARLSTQISIAGRLLVFQPQDDHVGVSQKIPGTERDALRARLQALVGDKATGGGGGFILRTNGEDSSDAELAEDIAY